MKSGKHKTLLAAALSMIVGLGTAGVAWAATGENPLSDAQIEQQLGKKLAYDRVGYGVVFNALTLQVHDGVATVGGEVHEPVAKDTALALVEHQPGVKSVVDQIRVAPVSIFDDQIRVREFRAVYGAPQLQKYAIDPAKPIRIVVDRGHVVLTGVVINKMDKQIAGMRAGLVPDVFSVDNQLVVADSKSGGQSGM